jgi:iodotyrosine deiodinase
MQNSGFIPLEYQNLSEDQLIIQAKDFYQKMKIRRSVRHFSDKEVPEEVIHNIIMTAASAPSGAHKQPWTFCVIRDPDIKAKIKEAAEKEEYENYHGRMSEEWLKDLEKLETDWHKDFLTKAPYLIVIFRKVYDIEYDGSKSKNYYVSESVGIAAGFLIAAIHMAGLVTLTHTPSPMNFLQEILGRPENEKPFLLLPVGYPTDGAMVPDISRKHINEVLAMY